MAIVILKSQVRFSQYINKNMWWCLFTNAIWFNRFSSLPSSPLIVHLHWDWPGAPNSCSCSEQTFMAVGGGNGSQWTWRLHCQWSRCHQRARLRNWSSPRNGPCQVSDSRGPAAEQSFGLLKSQFVLSSEYTVLAQNINSFERFINAIEKLFS